MRPPSPRCIRAREVDKVQTETSVAAVARTAGTKAKGRGIAGGHPGLAAAAVLACTIVLVPVVAIIWLAISGGGSDWPHLMANVIPRATIRTLSLVAMTG